MANENCICENEAEIIYRMYRIQNNGGLIKTSWIGQSVCCNDEEVEITMDGHTVTIKNLNGETISSYTHPENSTDTFEKVSVELPSTFNN